MKIRVADSSDLSFIRALEMDNYKYYLTDEVVNDDFHTFLIIFNDNELLGYISLWHDLDKAQIESFIIKEKNKGYGSNLIKYALDYLDGSIITLEVRESNSSAIHVYEKYGFKKVTIRKNYYSNGENAILMIRE